MAGRSAYEPRGEVTAAVLTAVAAATIAAGCASSGSATDGGTGGDRPATPAGRPDRRPPKPSEPLRAVRCPPALDNCAAATGRILYVEPVDPDGDGDAHYVIAGGGVTAPGITVIDVAAGLRPERPARPGDVVSAAGPVFTGSYGQRQIQALEVRLGRRGKRLPAAEPERRGD